MKQITLRIYKDGEPEEVATVRGENVTVAEGYRSEVSMEEPDTTEVNKALGRLL